MQTNIEHYTKLALSYVSRMRDLRFAGQVVFVIIVLLISWSGAKSIQTNYGLQKQVSVLNQQNTIQQLEDNNLALQNKYYNSNQYLELSARQNFGLAAPGEKEVLVPQSVALAYTVNLPNDNGSNANNKQLGAQHNFQAWINFFLHRRTSN